MHSQGALNSVLFLICTIQTIHAVTLICYCGSPSKPKEVALENVCDLVGTCYLDVKRSTIMYTHGYLGKMDGPQSVKAVNTLTLTNETNVCFLNWEAEANEGVIGFNYALVAENCKRIGVAFGQALLKLAGCGLSLVTLWLIGLSMGAHLMGDAGRKVSEMGSEVGRITGCDPAYLSYDQPLRLESALNKKCAAFVDNIHSTEVKYGMVTPTGDIDFYANKGYYTQHGYQPGCPTSWTTPLSQDDLCSHNRPFEYLMESFLTPTNFIASKSDNYSSWAAAGGANNENTYIGKLTNKESSGLYYLCTNPQAPFGKGTDGLKP